jgi:hypothetical protein
MKQTQSEWQLVFWITGSLYFFATLIYILFADVELQPWAVVEEERREEERQIAEQPLLK